MSLGDIWSYGVLLFEVITLGCMPYVDISNAEVKAEIMRNIELNTHEFNVLSKKCWRDMARTNFVRRFFLCFFLDIEEPTGCRHSGERS
jgi:hypothetical protein